MTKMNKIISLSLLTILLLLVSCSRSPYSEESRNALAACLAEKGVKEYGAFWCPNCAKQEKMFGQAMQIAKERGVYIECDPRCNVPKEELPKACRGIIGQTDLCLKKNVNKYPDWEFPNGERLVGVQELTTIATKAGCTFP